MSQGTTTVEDTPLHSQKLQKVLGHRFMTAASRADFSHIGHHVSLKDKRLVIYEWKVIPSQSRDTVMDIVQLARPGTEAILDAHTQVGSDKPPKQQKKLKAK